MKFIRRQRIFPELKTIPRQVQKVVVDNPGIADYIKWGKPILNEYTIGDLDAGQMLYFYTDTKVWYNGKFTYCYGSYRLAGMVFEPDRGIHIASNKNKQKAKEKVEALIIKEQAKAFLQQLKR